MPVLFEQCMAAMDVRQAQFPGDTAANPAQRELGMAMHQIQLQLAGHIQYIPVSRNPEPEIDITAEANRPEAVDIALDCVLARVPHGEYGGAVPPLFQTLLQLGDRTDHPITSRKIAVREEANVHMKSVTGALLASPTIRFAFSAYEFLPGGQFNTTVSTVVDTDLLVLHDAIAEQAENIVVLCQQIDSL